MLFKHRSSLLSVLISLTLLSFAAQLIFFIIHNHTTTVLDAFVSSSIPGNLFHPAIVLPLLEFISLQILAYGLFIGFLWFMTMTCSALLRLSAYGLGLFFWLVASLAVFTLNASFFPDSFFAAGLPLWPPLKALCTVSLLILGSATLLAYYQLFRDRRQRFLGLFFLGLGGVLLLVSFANQLHSQARYRLTGTADKPNIIIIGIDSLRPDYTGYFGGAQQKTPHIDEFLKKSVSFTEVYTPLARTFPAWVSILTGKHPKHSHARVNLSDAQPVFTNDTLAKRLQAAGYETIYASDEKRFSNITGDYGFDQLVGPSMGLNDFMLGGLSDFPLSNLLVNLPFGYFLLPYNYANRAAAITYEPDRFIELVKMALQQRQDKPLFLALHFCVSHWPFTWAGDQQPREAAAYERYRSAVAKADQQLFDLLQILKDNGLLEHSWVVLLSDHGTSFGLPGDRLLDEEHYQGDPERMKWLTVNKLSQPKGESLDLAANYSVNTAYGQGTDVLSLKQYQVLLALRYFGSSPKSQPLFVPHRDRTRVSLLDLTPTLLALLHLPPLNTIDGQSLELLLLKKQAAALASRPLYLETGYSLSELETNDIKPEKVISRTLHLYQVNSATGYLSVKPSAEPALLENKQRAVLQGPWLLARYPASLRSRFRREGAGLALKTEMQPAYYVLANMQTGEWTVGLDTVFAKQAPIDQLEKKLHDFYGAEI